MSLRHAGFLPPPAINCTLLIAGFFLGGCAAQPVAETGWTDLQQQVSKQAQGREEAEAALALRELLSLSIERALVAKSRPGGYLRHPPAHIGLPEPLQPVAAALTDAGRHDLVLDFIEDMNVAAEISAGKVAPLLREALAAMTIQDALPTVYGDDSAGAMRAFRRQSEARLLAGFEDPVRDSLRRAGALDSYRMMTGQYLKLPGGKKILFDYELYVRERAVNGLYVAIGEQEQAIRNAPSSVDSPLLRKMLLKPESRAAQ